MVDFVDDSDLHSIMAEATKVIESLKDNKTKDCFDLMEKAKEIECATDAYASKRQRGCNSFDDEVNRVKSRILVNKELLKTSISNVSTLRSRLNSEPLFRSKQPNMEFFTDATKENIDQKLGDVKQKIQNAIRDLSSKSKSGSKLEKMLRKYQGILEETTCLFKTVPDILKTGRSPAERVSRKDVEDTDQKALDLLKNMASLKFPGELPDLPEPEKKPEAGLGDWIYYEGFDTQDELDRFKELYKKMTGKDADEDISINEENTLEVMDDKSSDRTDIDDICYMEKLFNELIQAEAIPEDNADNA